MSMRVLCSMIHVSTQWITSRLNVRDERAASAVEYGILAVLIAAVVIAAVFLLGDRTSGSFDCTRTTIDTKGATSC